MRIRNATMADVSAATDLILRTKRLNNEFDPLFEIGGDIRDVAEKYISDSISTETRFVLVAVKGPKVVGVLRAEMRHRLFYRPSEEGFITDFYILPEYRRKALGNRILHSAVSELKSRGAKIIVADFPSQNEIARRFYTKRGFRPLTELYGKLP